MPNTNQLPDQDSNSAYNSGYSTDSSFIKSDGEQLQLRAKNLDIFNDDTTSICSSDDEISQNLFVSNQSNLQISADEPDTPTLIGGKCPLLLQMIYRQGVLVNETLAAIEGSETRAIHGTTLYIAKCGVDTRFGIFQAYVFQDLIGKQYTIALTYGDIQNKTEPLYIRLHSSCVTSETLRGSDCDCVQQLEGAIKIISERKHGILFYLLQEGRGAGYVGKARDRMLVQASCDKINTFEAYRMLGLKEDHRHYDNIHHISYLLGIRDAKFVLLTNNVDKSRALTNIGLHILRMESLEFEASSFNVAYLSAKQANGHILHSPSHTMVSRSTTPMPVVPLKPCVIDKAQRFIYCAAYYLPMKLVDDEIILTDDKFHQMFENRSADYYMNMAHPFILSYHSIRMNRRMIKIDPHNLKLYEGKHPNDPVCELLNTPYWFKVHVYYDIITSQEFIILTFGESTYRDYPIVRLQMESLFNRFPLRHATYRNRFKESVKLIVHYGVGIILLLQDDGRGAGFGSYAIDRMLLEREIVANSNDAREKICVKHDENDYNAAMVLLANHCPQKKIQMIMSKPTSLLKKVEYIDALKRYSYEVKKWLFLQQDSF